jgi:VRR-NUC domain.
MDEAQFDAKREKFLSQIDLQNDPLEKKIEEAWNKIAKKQGWVVRKMKNRDENSDPDRMYMRNGEMFFIEFKRRGKVQTDAQKLKAREIMEKGGFKVYVIDVVDKPLAELMFL